MHEGSIFWALFVPKDLHSALPLGCQSGRDNTVGWKSFSSRLLKAPHSCLFRSFCPQLCGLWDPSSPARVWTQTLDRGSVESYHGPPGNPPHSYLLTLSAANEKSILFSLLFSLLYQLLFLNCKFLKLFSFSSVFKVRLCDWVGLFFKLCVYPSGDALSGAAWPSVLHNSRGISLTLSSPLKLLPPSFSVYH